MNDIFAYRCTFIWFYGFAINNNRSFPCFWKYDDNFGYLSPITMGDSISSRLYSFHTYIARFRGNLVFLPDNKCSCCYRKCLMVHEMRLEKNFTHAS